MHPVLIYTIIFIASTVGLLFLFEKYQPGSIYLLLLISSVITYVFGKLMIKAFPSDDPMIDEIKKDDLKVRANLYKREIQFIFNIVQPDPKLQPNPKRLGESLEDCFDLDTTLMNARLQQYFGESYSVASNQPLPDMVEEIKQKFEDWAL